jgi:virulence-associated protein VagC
MEQYIGKIFQSGGSQAIRIPNACRFPEGVNDVIIKKDSKNRLVIYQNNEGLLKFLENYVPPEEADDFLVERDGQPMTHRDIF